MNRQVDDNTRRLLEPLLALGRRLRLFSIVEGVGWCLAMAVVAAAAQLVLDRLLVLGAGPRFVLLVIIVAFLGREIWRRVARPMGVRIDPVGVARLIERRRPDSHDSLMSATAFVSEANVNPLRNSPAMVRALIDRAVADETASATVGLLRVDRLRRFVGLGGASLLVCLVAVAIAPDTVSAYVRRNWLLAEAAWPSTATIVPEGFVDGRLSWPLGDDLTLVASAEDHVPRTLHAEIEYGSRDSMFRPMDRRGRNQFVVDLGPLPDSMRVRFRIGKFGVDEYTQWYEVDAVPRPFVKRATIEVFPPSYAGQVAYVLPQGQVSADLISGSRVRIEALFSHPVVEASLNHRADDTPAASASIENGTTVVADFEPERRGVHYFNVRDAGGLEDTRPVTYSLNLLKDPPPKVRLTIPDSGELIVPNATLNLSVHCEDNLGLRDVELAYFAERSESADVSADVQMQSEPMPNLAPGQVRYDAETPWPLLPLTLKAGDRLRLQIRSRDFQPEASRSESAPGSAADAAGSATMPANLGESIAYTLRVVTPEELLAELGRRENEWRREFEQVIKTQEQLNRRVLDLTEPSTDAAAQTTRQARIAQEARTQRQVAGRVRTVLRQFEQIYGEMKTNDVATPTVRKRLGQGVIGPMRLLLSESIPESAEMLERLRENFDSGLARQVEGRQKEIVRQMYAILAEMIKWEGYNEAVALLRDVLRLQKDVSEDTRAELEREIERMFESDDDMKVKPGSEDRP
ncbi:MAG: hypothetical protein H6819_06370 [Phycisphaerales bacterium]|nr:hypothetical protein [Phycisphaerales bacterium]MCB9858554.1 hypothetical protein [Phycisphaerales bacterium]